MSFFFDLKIVFVFIACASSSLSMQKEGLLQNIAMKKGKINTSQLEQVTLFL
jgi:hypothetical protein